MEDEILESYGEVYAITRPPKLKASQLRQAAPLVRQIGRKHKRSPTPQELGDKALLIFLSQRWDRHQTAISLLEEAVAEAPKDANLLNDLAAAYLASTRPDPPGNFLALSAASRALRNNPSLHEARFNLALALERCFLLYQARMAWQEYLRIDSESGWAEEARHHLHSLNRHHHRTRWVHLWKKRFYSDTGPPHFPWRLQSPARQDILEQTLPDWAALLRLARPHEASRQLDAAQKIGKYMRQGSLDSTVHDAVQAIIEAQEEKGNVDSMIEGATSPATDEPVPA